MTFNVINREEVRGCLSGYAVGGDGIIDEPLLAHLMTALEKPLLRREESLHRLATLPSNAPAWMVKKWEGGTVFYEFFSVPHEKISHIRDWIKGAMVNAARTSS